MKNLNRIQSTRDAILEATDRMLARSGYKKMTIDDLAKEVGIGKGSVYLHFTSKEEIALSHIDRIIEQLKENLREIAARPAGAEEKLKDMLVERVVYRFDSVQHYSQSLDDLLSQIRAGLLERRKLYFSQEAEIFAEVIREGQRADALADGEPLELSGALLSATNSLLPYNLSRADLGNRAEIAARTQRVADLLLSGLVRRT